MYLKLPLHRIRMSRLKPSVGYIQESVFSSSEGIMRHSLMARLITNYLPGQKSSLLSLWNLDYRIRWLGALARLLLSGRRRGNLSRRI